MARKRTLQVSINNALLVSRSDYADALTRIVEEGHCPFCEENLFRHHSEALLFKTTHWLATRNAWKYEGAKHHFLLIYRKHTENAAELPDSAWTDLGKAFAKLSKEHGLTGCTLFMRSGDMRRTGASVRHLHAQIVMGALRTKDTQPITALIGFKGKK